MEHLSVWKMLKGSDDGVYHTLLFFFLLFPSSGNLESIKHDFSETEDGNIQIPKRRMFYFLEYRMMEKVKNPSKSINFLDIANLMAVNCHLMKVKKCQ
jgi:hypothetical protein